MLRHVSALAMALIALGHAVAQTTCPRIAVAAAPDYSRVTAAVSGASTGRYRWLVNDAVAESGSAPQSFLLHADSDLLVYGTRSPTQARGVALTPGRWGQSFSLTDVGLLAYSRQGNYDPGEGSIEMWVALRADGSDPVYAQRDHVLFHYRAANGEWMWVAQASDTGILYAGGVVGGQWESAYGSGGSMRSWRAGSWHHLAFTWSASLSRIAFYVDGRMVAVNNEGRYWAPPATGAAFSLGGSLDGASAAYLIDEVRISTRPLGDGEIAASATREGPCPDQELGLPLAGRNAGDRIVLQWETPQGGACATTPYTFPGIPIREVEPPSTLLPPASTSIPLTVTSAVVTSCRYSVNRSVSFDEMTPFDSGAGSTLHKTTVRGLSADTTRVNDVYLRCASDRDYSQRIRYRSLPAPNPPFPRKGNLWGWWNWAGKGLEYMSRIDLWLGADPTPEEIRRLRELKPNVVILTSINAVENGGLPEDYYLKDTQGRKIEVWPGSYRLNLTKPKVAEHQARLAYEQVLASGLLIDGCFFDNVFLTQSWQTTDIYGNSRPIDADEDGKPDDPARFDAAWRAGVISEIRQWRNLMPWAYASGHHFRPPDPEILELFNGDSIGFMTANVIENRHSFSLLWTTLSDWFERGRRPVIMMTESSPPHQIAYGYDYDPLQKIPPSTLEFAKSYHPYMRFGLGVTLMTDGYFAHEYGDTWHGNDWWYDELDFDLGYPLGPPARIPFGGADRRNRVTNGDFEQPLEGTWELWVNTEAGASATAGRDATAAASGAASVRIEIAAAGQRQNWHIDFHQRNRSLTGGASYELTFLARGDHERPLTLSAQKGSPDWRNYGLYQTVTLGKEWQKYSVTFEATETVSDSRLQFLVGDSAGKVWLDAVELRERPREVFRRDFTNGTVLLNPLRARASVRLGPGYRRLNGTQAPRYEYILDDSGLEFRAGSGWQNVEYDSGEWKAVGPFYHDWGSGCRRCTGECGPSEWGLALRADGNYTIAAWWPAAPGSSSWSRQVVYELVAGGRVIASAAVDQTKGGDRWNVLFTRALRTSDNPLVRVRNLSAGEAIADALYLTSEARYNDGSRALTVDLEPMDAIVLERDADQPYVNTGNVVVDAASFLTPVSKGSWATLFGSNLAPSARIWAASDFSGARMPLSLDGVQVKVNGVAAPVYYVSPSQVNFQVPTDVEVGAGTVQVITPLGESNLAPVEVTEMWPALFLFAPDGRRYAAALHADGTVAARAGLLGEGVRSFPARSGETVVLWGSGFGPTTPPMVSGGVLSAPLPLENASRLAVAIGGRPAQVEYAGMTIAGVYQINVRVPEDLAGGDHEVAAALGGLQTQSGAYLTVGR